MDSLDELEARVKEAARTVADLRRKNRALAARLKRVESGEGGGPKDSAAGGRERAEARERVERLAARLDDLLDG